MNRRIWAILLVIVMAISMVPMTAMAAECNHSVFGGTVSWREKKDATCSENGYEASYFCNACGNMMIWIDGGYVVKTTGTIPATGLHNYVEGVCACGAVEPCDHNGLTYVLNNNDGTTHKVTCECGEVLNTAATHTYNDQGMCACGAIEPSESCDHNGLFYVKNNEDGKTHKVTCECGEVLNEAAAHAYANGLCACGAIEPNCDHDGVTYVLNNNDGATHKITCECGEVLNAAATHTYNDQDVCVCGAIKPSDNCDHNGLYYVKNNEDGKTHKVTCECGEVLSEATAHSYDLNGICACGAIHICHYDASVTSNNDGTHNINCTCGSYVQVGCLDNDGDGKCDSCGYVKYVAPDEAPAQVASTAGLDNVPKTGCAFVEWLYALIFG